MMAQYIVLYRKAFRQTSVYIVTRQVTFVNNIISQIERRQRRKLSKAVYGRIFM